MAAAHALHDGVGIPVHNVPAVVQALTGVPLTQRVITQDALRRVEGPVGTAYAPRRAAVPEAPVVYADNTGWRVGGEPAYLLTFETAATTVVQIRPRHRHLVGSIEGEGVDEGVVRQARAWQRTRDHAILCMHLAARRRSQILNCRCQRWTGGQLWPRLP